MLYKLEVQLPICTDYGYTYFMFKRDLQAELKSIAKQYPVVTIVGPRQSGKTTLVQEVFPKKPYVNLEPPDIRALVTQDPRAFLSQYPKGAILDEIQRTPTLLSYIQTIVDEDSSKKGLFILTGSHQLELHQAITQSLAGRTALLTLLPMSMDELQKAGFELSLDELLLNGGYPRIYKDNLNPTTAYRNYFQTYVERDVRQLIHIKNLSLFQKFIKLCAGRIGQIVDFSNLANEVGVSHHTIKEWLSILEASFVIFQLQPYFENFGKRLIKSPKLYFTDLGLATYLLDIENITQLKRDPLRGHLVENLVILELMKTRLNKGLDPKLYFYRDHHQNEVDVIYKTSNQLVPIEIKSSETFHPEFLKGIQYFQNLSKGRGEKGFLIYAGDKSMKVAGISILNYKNAAQAVIA